MQRARSADRYASVLRFEHGIQSGLGVAPAHVIDDLAETRIARDLKDLAAAARDIGFPVALKILSRDITHKSDVGGVALNIESNEELERAATGMLARCRESVPKARIGVTARKPV